ncbi:MAG: hypothetical protein ACLRFJ_00050 [Alphaproteobacteria bacterium]
MNMLNGISVFSGDSVWRQILHDLGATVLDAPMALSVNIDELKLNLPLSPVELRVKLLNARENTDLFKQIFGNNIPVFSALQRDIIIAIYRTGGISGECLRNMLGFSPDVTTHTVDTAISHIRKVAGHDFIKHENGKYIIGKL